MGSRLFSRPLFVAAAATLCSTLFLSGCQSFLNGRYASSVHPDQGLVRVQGLAQSVVIRRNPLGMPLIETTTFHDALFWATCTPPTASARWSACACSPRVAWPR
jgi:acyl-homoserine-lactone acylase